MGKFIGVVIFILSVLLLLFLVFQSWGVLPMDGLGEMLLARGPVAVVLIFLLLVFDLILPVPSSVLMTLNGIFLGPIWGAVASFAAATLGACLGFGLGRKLGRPMVRRFMSDRELTRMDGFVDRFGPYGIILSRAVPMMTETASCVAGLSRMTFGRFLVASIIGTLPITIAYAWAGANSGTIQSGIMMFLLLAALPAVGWLVVSLIRRGHKRDQPDTVANQ